MNLGEIVRRNAVRFPHKPALVAGAVSRSWAELDERVNRLCHALIQQGIEKGDRVALLLPNCPEFFELYFGLGRAGAVAVPLNYRLTPREMVQLLRHAQPSLWIAHAQYLDQVTAVQQELPELTRLVVLGGTHSGAETYESLIESGSPAPFAPRAGGSDPFALFYTSGTTGLPKGAVVSHGNLEANCWNQFLADQSRQDDINLVATPVYHMGAVFMAMTYLMLGCTQVILKQFEAGAWLQTLEEQRATVSLLIPTMLNSILNHPDFERRDRSSLRLIFYGGGPMPLAVLERALRSLGCGFTQGYGLTETLEATFLVAADHVIDGTEAQRRRLASAGREALGAEVRIVDDTGRDLPPGEVGEVLIRSRSVIQGYWNDPAATAEAIRDGWFHTGDMGYLDEDRYLFIVDRKKDVIVSGGVNIYSKEVEEVLYAHPAILEAAVIGLPDEHWGEVVTAIVALRPGESAGAGEIIEYCRSQLAGFKKPREVFFVDALPKNPSGKILKRELRRMVLEQPERLKA